MNHLVSVPELTAHLEEPNHSRTYACASATGKHDSIAVIGHCDIIALCVCVGGGLLPFSFTSGCEHSYSCLFLKNILSYIFIVQKGFVSPTSVTEAQTQVVTMSQNSPKGDNKEGQNGREKAAMKELNTRQEDGWANSINNYTNHDAKLLTLQLARW